MKEKGKWWKIYFWALVTLTAFDIGSNLLSGEGFKNNNPVETVIGVISLIGLLGFIYQTPIFLKYIWAGVFLANLMVLSLAVYKIRSDWPEITEEVATGEVLLIYGITLIFIVPLLVALFSYAFKSSQLWNAEHV